MMDPSTRQKIPNHGQGAMSLDQRLMELKEAVQQRKSELKNDCLAYQLPKKNFPDQNLECFLGFLHGDLDQQLVYRSLSTKTKMMLKSNFRTQVCSTRDPEQKEEEKEDSSSSSAGIISSLAPKDVVMSALEEITSVVQTSLVCQNTLVYKILLEAKILQTADFTKSHTPTAQRTDLLTRQVSDLYKAISAQLSSDTKELQKLKREQELSLVSFLQGIKAMNAQYSSTLGGGGTANHRANCSAKSAGKSSNATGTDSCDTGKIRRLTKSAISTAKKTQRLRETMEGNIQTINGRLQTAEDSVQQLQNVVGKHIREDGFSNPSQRSRQLQLQQKLEQQLGAKTAALDLRLSAVEQQLGKTCHSKTSKGASPSRKLRSAMEDLTFVSEVSVE